MNDVISAQMSKGLRSITLLLMMVCMIPIAIYFFHDMTTSGDDWGFVVGTVDGLSAMQNGFSDDYSLATMIIGIFAALMLMTDFSSGSISQIISKGTGRVMYVAGTQLSTTLCSLLMICVAYLAFFLMGTFAGNGTGIHSFTEVLWFAAWMTVLAFTTVAFVMMITVLFRKTSISIIAGIITPAFLKYPFAFRLTEEPSLAGRIVPIVTFSAIGILFCIISMLIFNHKKEV